MAQDTLGTFQQECRAQMKRQFPGETPRLVFGDGNECAPRLMLIGEAPGEQEAIQGKPFVGKAGKNLTDFLQSVGLSRGELYISNVVKFRPSRVSAAGRTVNRPPTKAEITLFLPWLYREISLIQPKAIVTLGNVALHAFVSAGVSIGDCHGLWRTAEIPLGTEKALYLPHFALYHPASVIYNRALEPVYRADLSTLRETLQHNGGHTDT